MKTLIASFVAAGLLIAPASARTPFDDLRDSAPRSIFTDIQDTAPRTIFDDRGDQAPRSDGVFGDLELTAP